MSNTIHLEVDLIDFDRSMSLPVSLLFLWAQKCRMPVYFAGPLARLRETGGTMMVKAQSFEFVNPDQKMPGNFSKIQVTQHIASVGKTSITLELSFTENQEEFARGIVVMVCVSGGRATELPKDIAEDLLRNHMPQTRTKTKELMESKTQMVKEAVSKSMLSPILRHDVLFRSSDEDTNRHVRHIKYAQAFEDSIQEHLSGEVPPTFRFLSVEYVKETRRGERCTVSVFRAPETDEKAFSFSMHRGDEIVCRGLAKF